MINNIYNGMGIKILKADLYFPLKTQQANNRPVMIIIHKSNRAKESIYDIDERQQDVSGFKYHYYIRKDGDIIAGRMEYMASDHCKGHEADSISICLEGLFTEEVPHSQFIALHHLIEDIEYRRGVMRVFAHNELDKNVECPGKDFPINQLRSNIQVCGHPGDLPDCDYKRRMEADPQRWNPLP